MGMLGCLPIIRSSKRRERRSLCSLMRTTMILMTLQVLLSDARLPSCSSSLSLLQFRFSYSLTTSQICVVALSISLGTWPRVLLSSDWPFSGAVCSKYFWRPYNWPCHHGHKAHLCSHVAAPGADWSICERRVHQASAKVSQSEKDDLCFSCPCCYSCGDH